MNADELTEMVTELHARYPRFPRATIRRLAERIADQYHGARVTAFVPMLVRRQTIDQLRYADGIAAPAPTVVDLTSVPDREAAPAPAG